MKRDDEARLLTEEKKREIGRYLRKLHEQEAMNALERLAAKIQEAKPSLSKEQAFAEALRRRPDWYDLYNGEG